jgi:tetratricopeptide (TPR) repeat protein
MGVIIPLTILGIVVAVLIAFLVRTFLSPRKIGAVAEMVRAGKTNAAITAAKRLVSTDQSNMEAHYLLGKAYIADNQPRLALMELEMVNRAGVFSPIIDQNDFRVLIAGLYRRFGKSEDALKEYAAEYVFEAGLLFAERGEADRAGGFYRKTLELDPAHPGAQAALGLLLYRAGNLEEARSAFQTVLESKPDHAQSSYYLGRIHKDSRDYQGALSHFQRAQRDPEFKVKALVERGACLLAVGDLDSATAELSRAVRLSEQPRASETLYARYFLAASMEKQRDLDGAIEQWEQIHGANPSFRDVADKLSKYQDLRVNDTIKDFVTAGEPEFLQLCRSAVEGMGLYVQDSAAIRDGCAFVATEGQSSMRNARKITHLIHFLRGSEQVPESTVRSFYDAMKKRNAQRGMLLSSAAIAAAGRRFAETIPIELRDREALEQVLSSAPPAPSK